MHSATTLYTVVTLMPILGVLSAAADTITVNGAKHENVIVRQSDTRYYIQNPADGAVFSVDKDTVAGGDLQLTYSTDERSALQRKWELANRGETETEPSERESSAPDRSRELQSAKERQKPIRIAADAATKRIASPRTHYAPDPAPSRLRGAMGNPGALRTRAINLGLGGDTMPKIVVSNFGGRGGAFAPGGGGLGGSGGYGSSQFSNITQLFSNIDDTLVGETPAPLGNEIVVLR